MIKLEHISKSYGNVSAVKSVSFEVAEGELFGLIGPDGAGKTSIFRVLTTLLIPDQGKASVAGYDIIKDYKQIRKNVGYMPGKFSLYQDLSVEENLNFFATIFGTTIEENYDLIKDIYVMLEPFKKRRAGALSGGMKQKLALCCALIHKPKVLFLDEPTTGVDPVSRKEFWEMLQQLKNKEISILVSTAYMDEADLCDRVALIQSGEILKIDEPNQIIKNFEKKIWSVRASDKYDLLVDLKHYGSRYNSYAFGETMHYIDWKEDFNPEDLFDYLVQKGHLHVDISITVPDIEDIFIDMTFSKHDGVKQKGNGN